MNKSALVLTLLFASVPSFGQAPVPAPAPTAQPQAAQPAPPLPPRRALRQQRLDGQLSLTDEQKQQLQAIREEAKTKALAVLTPEQQQQMQQARQTPALPGLTRRLNLTPEQQSKLAPILTERRQRIQALRADTTLTRQDRRAKVQQIQQETQGKIEALLNDQQRQQYNTLRANQQGRSGQLQGRRGRPRRM